MNRCPIEICSAVIPSHMLMCKHHWLMVPRPLRSAVWLTWNRRTYHEDEASIAAHQRAKIDAIKAVRAKLEDS